MADRYLYLVRHGHYHTAKDAPRYGALTALGRRQARRIATRMQRAPIDVIRHSDLARARQTADLIAEKLPDVPMRGSRLLREGLPTQLPKHVASIALSERDIARDRERMCAAHRKFFRACRGRDRHEVLVCHGNLIRYLVRLSLGDEADNWWKLATLQCGLTTVRISPAPRGSTLLGFNDVGHLPRDMQTVL